MNKNQQIIDKIEHGGKDSLTIDDMKYIQECFEDDEFIEYPSFPTIMADMLLVALLLIAFSAGFGLGAWVF
jgi:hypothetical protein